MKVTVNRKNQENGGVRICISILLDSDFDTEEYKNGLTINLLPDEIPVEKGIEEVSVAFENYSKAYTQKDRKTVRACCNKFKSFVLSNHGKVLQESTCEEFWQFLQERLHGNTPANYFKKFKQFLSKMVDDGVLDSNPAKDIKLKYFDYRRKECLSLEEIKVLEHTPCKNPEVKKAFLFSCFSGLRWCDVSELSYNDIDIERQSLSLMQRKVEGHSSKAYLHSFLNTSAMDQINMSRCSGRVFLLPSYSYSSVILKDWIESSGIKKHISFHSARHSFISNLIDKGVDLKTVADLAGHSSTKHTERYIHNSDSRLMSCVSLIEL